MDSLCPEDARLKRRSLWKPVTVRTMWMGTCLRGSAIVGRDCATWAMIRCWSSAMVELGLAMALLDGMLWASFIFYFIVIHDLPVTTENTRRILKSNVWKLRFLRIENQFFPFLKYSILSRSSKLLHFKYHYL